MAAKVESELDIFRKEFPPGKEEKEESCFSEKERKLNVKIPAWCRAPNEHRLSNNKKGGLLLRGNGERLCQGGYRPSFAHWGKGERPSLHRGEEKEGGTFTLGEGPKPTTIDT